MWDVWVFVLFEGRKHETLYLPNLGWAHVAVMLQRCGRCSLVLSEGLEGLILFFCEQITVIYYQTWVTMGNIPLNIGIIKSH